MLTKTIVKKSIKNLPDSFSIDQLIEQLIFTEKIEEGLKQAEDGKIVTNEDVKNIIDKWSS
jgi:predicted transcriptional regulator